MKNTRSKRLPKILETVCDFNKVQVKSNFFGETTTPVSDPTTATVTIIITTANTHSSGKMLI